MAWHWYESIRLWDLLHYRYAGVLDTRSKRSLFDLPLSGIDALQLLQRTPPSPPDNDIDTDHPILNRRKA